MINNVNENICCICLDDEQIYNTTKCSQCVNKFHVSCQIKWGITCPCCKTVIKNNEIKFILLLNFICNYKYIIFVTNCIIGALAYIIYNYEFYNTFEFFLLIYYLINISITVLIDIILKYYDIEIESRYFY